MIGMSVGSMVGHLAHAGVRHSTTSRSRAQPNVVTLLPAQHRRLRHRVGDPARRDAAVGARPRAVRATRLFEVDHLRDALTDLVRAHVGGFRPDPNADRRQARRRFDADDSGDPMAGAAAGVRRPRGAARRRDVARAARAAATPRRRSSPPSSATPTGSSTPSPSGSSAATRCASPRPSAAGGSRPRPRRLVRRAAARHPPRRGPGRTRQGVRPGRRRPCRRTTGCARCSSVPDSLPTPSEIEAPGLWLARVET